MAARKQNPPSPPTPPPHDLNCLTIAELQRLARERMDKLTRDYYNEGADGGTTLAENESAYRRYRIRPRVLRDISRIDSSVSIFGHRSVIPLGVAPAAMQCLAHPDGEIATARACRAKGVAMGLSSFSTSTLEDVREASGEIPNVLQLYLFEDKAKSLRLIERAKKAGYKAVMLTVDTPMLGRRNLEIRNQFALPSHLKIANFPVEDEADDEEAIDDEPSSSSSLQEPTPPEPKTTPPPPLLTRTPNLHRAHPADRPDNIPHARAKPDPLVGDVDPMAEARRIADASVGEGDRNSGRRPSRGQARRGRDDRVEPRRTTAGRRAGDAGRAAGGGRRRAGPHPRARRRRDPARHRRVQGAGAGRRLLLGRPPRPLGPRV